MIYTGLFFLVASSLFLLGRICVLYLSSPFIYTLVLMHSVTLPLAETQFKSIYLSGLPSNFESFHALFACKGHFLLCH
ncbi:MAG: hypothetical protein NXY57DRAFT_705740 [Lentinula lateritia]|nr:MAG: hypothetical protein NXY57DRAFT_705740 [Lentinula lateritia]